MLRIENRKDLSILSFVINYSPILFKYEMKTLLIIVNTDCLWFSEIFFIESWQEASRNA